MQKFIDFEAELGSDNEHHDHHVKRITDSQDDNNEVNLDEDLPEFLNNDDVTSEMGELRIRDIIQKE